MREKDKVFPLFATPHFYLPSGITCEYFVQQQEDDLVLENVNVGVKVEWCLRINGSNVYVYIIRVSGFFSDKFINGTVRFIVLGNIKHR